MNTYTIVGLCSGLPSDVKGWSAEHIIGGVLYNDDMQFSDDMIVDVSILTNNINKIYETTLGLADKLNLYETSEELSSSLIYNNILLNYSLVNGSNFDAEDYSMEYHNSTDFKGNMLILIIFVILITRYCFYYCDLYCF